MILRDLIILGNLLSKFSSQFYKINIFRFNFKSFFNCFQGILQFVLSNLGLGLSEIRFDERLINLDGLVAVSNAFLILLKFQVSICSVCIINVVWSLK